MEVRASGSRFRGSRLKQPFTGIVDNGFGYIYEVVFVHHSTVNFAIFSTPLRGSF